MAGTYNGEGCLQTQGGNVSSIDVNDCAGAVAAIIGMPIGEVKEPLPLSHFLITIDCIFLEPTRCRIFVWTSKRCECYRCCEAKPTSRHSFSPGIRYETQKCNNIFCSS